MKGVPVKVAVLAREVGDIVAPEVEQGWPSSSFASGGSSPPSF